MSDEKKNTLDDTRERLEIDNLDEGSRKQLFNKFVEKGGEVINSSSQKTQAGGRVAPINRATKTQGSTSSQPTRSSSSQNYGRTRNTPSRSTSINDRTKNTEPRKKLPFIKRIILWFKAYSASVINFDGKTVNESFLLFIYKNILPALTEIDSLVYNILYPADDNKEVADEKHDIVIRSFKDLNDYELLERVRKFNNKEAYSNIIKSSSMDIDAAYNNLDDFKAVFKPLFAIRFYTAKLNAALSAAFIAHNNVEKLSKELIDARISSFNKIIDMLYNRYYNRLQILISYISQKELASNVELNEFLQIADEDILGYYVLQIKKEIKKKIIEEREASRENKNEPSIEDKKASLRESKIISIGMAIIEKSVSFEKDMNEKDPFYNVPESDKIYKLKVLFDFLEREYGYVLISNKVKYAVIYEKQKKTDYQKLFTNSFASLAEMPIKLNEYANMLVDMRNIERDDKINFAQRSTIVSEKRSRVNYIANNIKNSFISIIVPIKEALDNLLLNKEERERIIENQENIIQIDQSYLKKKPRIQGYTVIKAITEAYYFISALNDLVTSNNYFENTENNKTNNRIKETDRPHETDNFSDDIEKAKESINNLENEETYDVDTEETNKDEIQNNVDNFANIEDINTEVKIEDILNDIENKK